MSAASGLEHLKPFLPGLESALEDSEVSEIMIYGPANVWVERAGRLAAHAAPDLDEAALERAAIHIARPLGLDPASSPIVDARLDDGSRVAICVPPASLQVAITVRRFGKRAFSAAAGITFHNFYSRLYPDAIRGPEVIDFLKSLVRHIRRPLLVVWDRLPAHKSALVQEFLGYSEGYIETEYPPAYAPELNPVEYLWGYWKQHQLPNVCLKDYWDLDACARQALRRMRKPRLIAAFWKQSSGSWWQVEVHPLQAQTPQT